MIPARTVQLIAILSLTATIISLPFCFVDNLSEKDRAWLEDLPIAVAGKSYPQAPIHFVDQLVGPPIERLPLISNVQVHTFPGAQKAELVVCDIQQRGIYAYAYNGVDNYAERLLIDDLRAPASCHFADMNNDGQEDILVAELGDIFPNNERVGQVLIYLKQGERYVRHVAMDNCRRVADVRAGDFDNDGDLDLVVAEFGHYQGSVLLLEQHAPMQFRSRILLEGCGSIHVPIADFDGDGDLDIAAVLSQDEEEVWVLSNDGSGQFEKHMIFHEFNFELGSGGLVAVDMDQDNDMDLLLPAGDNLERGAHFPQQFHGCYYLENMGDNKFTPHKISDLPGTYAAAAGDVDGDKDIDVVLVSMSNDFSKPDAASMVILSNDGQQNFKTQQVAAIPIQLITCAIGDINADGKNDIFTGSLRIYPPFRHMSRVHAWVQE